MFPFLRYLGFCHPLFAVTAQAEVCRGILCIAWFTCPQPQAEEGLVDTMTGPALARFSDGLVERVSGFRCGHGQVVIRAQDRALVQVTVQTEFRFMCGRQPQETGRRVAFHVGVGTGLAQRVAGLPLVRVVTGRAIDTAFFVVGLTIVAI